MAGLTKEQRAQREAEKLATEQAAQNNPALQELQEQQEQQVELVTMFTEYLAFPGAPTTADVHPDEVENWMAAGWRTEE